MSRTATIAAILAWSTLPVGHALSAEPPQFNGQARPIFKAYCFECHGEGPKLKGGLDLRLRRLVASGGDSGSAFVPGKPSESLLIQRVANGDMPPTKKKLTAAEIEVLRKWIAAGAPVESKEPETLGQGFQITEQDRQWWAFQPIRRPEVPKVPGAEANARIRNPIDAFLLSKLNDKKLSFAAPADRLTLLRRVTFDLTGLPPTPEEVDAFLQDSSANAYEKVVERLLASPRYGERWGRHWLDVAGYADSEGGSPQDPVRPTAWKYRDYVIRSYNADKPFDQFIREQLAGDELVKPPYPNLSPADLDKLIATGFLRMAPDPSGVAGVDQKLVRNQTVTDTVKIVSSAFLGVTVGCAECHNHRYDPIPQVDFYRLRAILEPAFNLPSWKSPAARKVSLYTAEERKMAAAIEAEAALHDKDRLKKQGEYIEATFQKELAKLPMTMRDRASKARNTPAAKRTPDQKKLMREHPSLNVSAGSLYLYDSKAAAVLKKMNGVAIALRKKKPVEQFVRVMTEGAKQTPPTYRFHRGDPDQPKEKVQPGGLSILDASLAIAVPSRPTPGGDTGRRLALANWLTNPKHPLTSRVIVNRIWMNHFGKGIAPSPGDFGRLGERPTHPKLLDWLASEFLANGWSVKKMHRLILTSAAYRQSSVSPGSTDPDNTWLGRFPLRRLDSESVRDSMLAVSGKLNPKMFGQPVPVMEDDAGLIVIGMANRDGAQYKLGDESVPEGEESRRSIYVQVRRTRPLNILETFDWAKPEPNCEARNSSTSTPQSLLLINGEFTMRQAGFLAQRVSEEAGSDPALQAARAWKLVYGAEPTAKEKAGALAFLKEAAATFAKQPLAQRPASPAKAKKGAKKNPKTAKGSKGSKGSRKPGSAAPPSPETRALAAFCQALLSSNRFLYVD